MTPNSKAKVLVITALFTVAAYLPAAKTFIYCSEASPAFFSPALTFDGAAQIMLRNVYTRLVEYNYGTTTLVPGLAEKWSVSKDALTYTFNLRKDVWFHETPNFKPTRPMNADDVVFSLNRQLVKDHPFHKISGGNYDYFESMGFSKLLKSVEKVNDSTVKITLNNPEAPFLADMAMDFSAIYSAEFADQMMKKGTPEKLDSEPVGTGPFVFVKYEKDQQVRLKAHPKFYGTKPKIDTLIFSITTDPNLRLQKLKTGECHLISDPAPSDLAAVKADSKLRLMEKEGMNIAVLAFNTTKKPFDNVDVRKAIYHALNRPSYIDAIYLGNAALAKNPYPPTFLGYNKSIKDYDFNIETAKKLLKKAGHPNGFETDLWVLPVSRFYNPNGKKMGEMMQADLAKIGVKAKIVLTEWGTFLNKTREGEHQLAQIGWQGDNGDPDNFVYMLLSCEAVRKQGANQAKWCNPAFDKEITKARQVTDPKQRAKLYEKAQVIFHDQVPWVPIAHNKMFRAMSKKVTGYQIHPLGHDYFGTVDLLE